MRFKASPILLISTALLCSCLLFACSTPKMVLEQGGHLSIKESYIQKVVPGTQEHLPADFLFITLNTFKLKTVLIDSIHYKNLSFPIKNSKIQYKIDLSKGLIMTNTSKTKNVATVFYSQHNKTYYLHIEGLTRKETLYLP
jgi:hypothetical protein